MRIATLICAYLLYLPYAWPQSMAAFEVASVKQNLSGGPGGAFRVTGSEFMATNVTLLATIRYAFGVKDYQVQGPGWIGTERYDIQAKLADNQTRKDIPILLQNLIADRFAAELHREMRTMPQYALTSAKGGVKMMPSASGESSSMTASNHEIKATRISMQVFSSLLSGQMDRLVIDRTKLVGMFDVNLNWSPEGATADSSLASPTIFTALQEQLGLKLEPTTGPAELIIVARANRVPTNQ